MKTIEVRNNSTFEPDVGIGRPLARRETAKVPDTPDNRALIEDGHLRLIDKTTPKAKSPEAKTTPTTGENGGSE